MILATAGHVDHGKTTLIRALTGIDTDRLAEEKQRGMSIDLGFAHADLGNGRRTAFVDVPGHEKFARNMLAGLAAIDGALLVIAADDGPMPQTREHLAVLDLLGVAHGAVVITKCDLVTPERLAAAYTEVADLLSGSPLRSVPRFEVDTVHARGLAALRAHLEAMAAARQAPVSRGHFRHCIDRAFQIDGAGWVVTGSILAGAVAVGDSVTLAPQGLRARVRGIQVHDAAVDSASTGMRCAINLGGDLKRAALGRGQWLIAPALHGATRRLDVRLRFLVALPAREREVQLHLGATALPARLLLLDDNGLARLVVTQDAHAVHGDRVLVRDPAARRVIAGGHVIDPQPPLRRRASPERLAQLNRLDQDSPAALAALLTSQAEGVALDAFARARNLGRPELDVLLREQCALVLELSDGAVAIHPDVWTHHRQTVVAAVRAWHSEQPDSVGPTDVQLRQCGLPPSLLPPVVRELLSENALLREGICLRLPDHRPRLNDGDADLLQRLQPLLAAGGLRPPIVGELAAVLGLVRNELLIRLQHYARLGYLVQVAPNRFYPPRAALELAELARALAEESPQGFDAAAYRDRSGIGRNLTIEVLEFLDRSGVTRRTGDRRRLAQSHIH